MRQLYIDTSSAVLYTGIVEDDRILYQIKKEFGHDMSIETLPQIANMFTMCNLNPKDIDKIIVVNGPGSFTGIRIGITIAKIYAWSLNIPITTINSLEAMMSSIETTKNIVPILDARRGYVYAGLYNNKKECIIKPQHIKYEKFKDMLKEYDYVFVTNDFIEDGIETIKYDANILKIVERYANNENVNPHLVNPEYLKLTEAEEKNAHN